MMKADKWIPFIALWVITVASKREEVCETHVVTAHFGSSVVLPCNFSSNDTTWVKWTQKVEPGSDLVQVSSNRSVKFLDPRSGRVKTFPNQASERNYSIRIDGLQKSDMGTYYCRQNDQCIKVKLSEDEGELLSEESCNKDFCKVYRVPGTLGSSVSLPCFFQTNAYEWVTWARISEREVVRLSYEGRVLYQDPRSGRVKAFPNQALEGNYTIAIDELKNSDLGSYCCMQRSNCLRVELLESKSTLSLETMLLIYISAGLAVLILLSLFGYFCCLKSICFGNKNRPEGVIITASETPAGPSAPPQDVGMVNVQHIGTDNNLVYENDDQYIAHFRNPTGQPAVQQHQAGIQSDQSGIGIYPNLDEFKFERVESQRTKQRFHIELFNRLRQASLNRHFYANQGEIRKQQAMAAQAENQKAEMGRRKAKDSREYQNPIYNRSTDHLNRL